MQSLCHIGDDVFCDSPKCNSKVVLRKESKLSTNRLMEDNVVSRDSYTFSGSHIEIVELVYEALSFNY